MKTKLLRLLIAAFISLALNPVNAANYYCYVSHGGAKEIAIYQMDAGTGELTAKGTAELPGAPGSLATDPQRKYLYAAVRSAGAVSTLSVDQKSGALKLLGTTKVAGNPVYVVPDKTGKFLLTSYYADGKAAVYAIGPDGVVKEENTALLVTDKNPHSIQMDGSNRHVFIPNTGADKILQFNFDAATGTLMPNNPAFIGTEAGTGPRHFTFHPTKPFVYFVNEKGSSVGAFKLNANGTLAHLQTISTLPENFDGKNTCADIHVTPDGKFLYGSNRGHDSLAGYAIDQATGKLKALGQTPTEKTPREFEIDPTGNFVFAAGQTSNQMASYRIDPQTGALKPLKVYPTGKGPAWVLIIKVEG